MNTTTAQRTFARPRVNPPGPFPSITMLYDVFTTRSVSTMLAEKQPSLQFTTPEQLGAMATFLCSSAADNIRGVAFNVDGGWAAQ